MSMLGKKATSVVTQVSVESKDSSIDGEREGSLFLKVLTVEYSRSNKVNIRTGCK